MSKVTCAAAQDRLPPNVPKWHIDYFELRLKESRWNKKNTLALLCPHESRKQSSRGKVPYLWLWMEGILIDRERGFKVPKAV